MSSDPKYALDANIFIEAKNRYYGFDICPGFWKALLQAHKAGRVWSIDRIEQELKDGNDELREWVEEHTPETFFDRTDDKAVIEKFTQMINWVTNQSQYKPEAKDEFADAADGWLAAYAKVYGMTVVTHEVFNLGRKNKVPLPNVCHQFGIEFTNTFEMLRELGIEFDLRKMR